MDVHPSTRVILWSAPRSTSTLFEHSVGRLNGVRTFHELYTNAAYFGEERTFQRYCHEPPTPHTKFSDIRTMLEAPYSQNQAIFCKEMAYSITGHLEALPDGYRHSFLIRKPRKTIVSMHRLAISGDAPEWSTFDPREVGFVDLWRLYEYVAASTSVIPVVIDSDDLLHKPHAALQAYCENVGLVFDENMLQWHATKNHERLDRWGSVWYQNLLHSTGFTQPTPSSPDATPLPAYIEAAIKNAEPYYEKLYARRLVF